MIPWLGMMLVEWWKENNETFDSANEIRANIAAGAGSSSDCHWVARAFCHLQKPAVLYTTSCDVLRHHSGRPDIKLICFLLPHLAAGC